jgi:hypothetical protein
MLEKHNKFIKQQDFFEENSNYDFIWFQV